MEAFREMGLHGTMEISGIAPGHYELTQGDPPRIVDLDLASSQQVDANAGSATNTVSGTVRMASGAPRPRGDHRVAVRMRMAG